MQPMVARYHIRLHQYFNRILLVDENRILGQAVKEHAKGGWPSPYRALMKDITNKYGIEHLTGKESKSKISSYHWDRLAEDVYKLKSLKPYSIRSDPWTLPGHVIDTDYSKTLCKMRTGNAGLGNRGPIKKDGTSISFKECPLCADIGRVVRLSEEHITFECVMLPSIQQGKAMAAYKKQHKGKLSRALLWGYLGGDKCDDQELLNRAEGLDTLLSEYFSRALRCS